MPHLAHAPGWIGDRRRGGRAAARIARKRVRERRGKLRAYLEWIDAGWSARSLTEALAPVGRPEGDSGRRLDGEPHWNWLKSRGYDPSRLLDGVMGHEGKGRSFGPKGHQKQIEKALKEGKCGDAGP